LSSIESDEKVSVRREISSPRNGKHAEGDSGGRKKTRGIPRRKRKNPWKKFTEESAQKRVLFNWVHGRDKDSCQNSKFAVAAAVAAGEEAQRLREEGGRERHRERERE
jgi:hypothetical protein